MAKIRGIKPDYWTDEDIVDLSIEARLLFIGLWSYACDNGHVEDKPKQIKMRVFPGDDVNAANLLHELHEGGRIARSAKYITIPNFAKHQRVDKRYFQYCDAPGCRPGDDSQPETRGVPHETTTGARGGLAVVSSGPPGDGDGDGDGELTTAMPERFEEFWEVYDKKRGRKAAIAKYRLALRKPDVTASLLIAAASAYIDWVRSEGKHPQFTKDPATWLNGEHWTDEREGSSTKPKVDRDWALR